MSTPKRNPEGIRPRHSRRCRTRTGGRSCNCTPSWEASVYLVREDTKLRKTFPTLKAAKAWRAEALTAAGKGKLRPPTRDTVAQAWTGWHEAATAGAIPARGGKRFKRATLRGYERAMRVRVPPELGHTRLTDVHRRDVQALADRLIAQGATPSTVHNTLDPLRCLFRRAVRDDVVAVDPTDGLELHRPKNRRERIADRDEAARLLAARPDEDRALWATAFYGGLRRGELRALRWRHVDLAARRIRVHEGWDDVEGRQDTKSHAGERTVPILALLAPALAEHRERRLAAGAAPPDALVFGRSVSEPFEPSTVRRRALAAWDAANQRVCRNSDDNAELMPITLHEARHTFASLLIASGANAKVLQTVMGHATIQMTFDRYGHLMPDALDDLAAAADAYLARQNGEPVRLAVVR
jgi:integrase